MRQRSHNQSGFTLTELLVVIATITILAAILIAVITQSKKQTHTTTMLSNGRQINFALLVYAGEHDDAYPALNLDPLVQRGVLPSQILLDHNDPFKRGYFGQQRWCRDSKREPAYPSSYEMPLMQHDLNRAIATLQQYQGNPGLLALRTIGDRVPGPTGDCNIQMLYHKQFFRFTLEGAAIKRNLELDNNGQRFCPWDLFTDNRLTCSYRHPGGVDPDD
ncbi:hypothetical protein CCB80_01785 [Armatimonadetes bacterium Uphvl-Ar1]|nr:hypothetical protein CCB80_01785 [Armatimonadetes bacterium Uphvl-Ar1]